jgi:hypothetical protein
MKHFLILLLLCAPYSHANLREEYANKFITQEIKDYLTEPLKPDQSRQERSLPKPSLKVGIIGAGFAGLYSALILNSLDIDYEILEANKEHVGGRAFTYYFQGKTIIIIINVILLKFGYLVIWVKIVVLILLVLTLKIQMY